MPNRTVIHFNTLFVRFYVLVTGLAFGLGGAFLLGGPERFSSPSFAGLRNLFGWTGIPPHLTVAALFSIYGFLLVMQLGRWHAVHVLRAGIAVYLFLVLGLAYAVAIDGRAALSGVVVYSVAAIAHAYLSDHLTHRGWEGC